MKSYWSTLIFDNPMLIEISRFRRKFLTFGGGGSMSGVVLGLLAVCYAGLLLLTMNFLGDLPPIVIIVFQTGLFCFVAPGMLYSSIAGERERRSWDLLLVAPLTTAQIVAGKFMGALAALGTGGLLFLVPIVLTALTYEGDRHNLYDVMLAEVVSFSFIVMVCALTILLSARVRRPFMALGATLGTLTVFLIVIPSLVSLLFMGDRVSTEFFFLFHPFLTLVKIGEAGGMYNDDLVPLRLFGWPQIVTYLFLSTVMLVWAERTLKFADNDVKFIPKAHQDA